jgi:hypothetical protein
MEGDGTFRFFHEIQIRPICSKFALFILYYYDVLILPPYTQFQKTLFEYQPLTSCFWSSAENRRAAKQCALKAVSNFDLQLGVTRTQTKNGELNSPFL